MAYDDSGQMPISQNLYHLGEYEFFILVSQDPINDKTFINVECTKGTAHGYDGIEIDGIADPDSWSVEANETEASVYVHFDGGGINAVRVDCSTPVEGYSGYRGDYLFAKLRGYGFDATLYKSSPGVTWITQYNGELYAANESGNGGLDGICYVTSYPNPWGFRDVPTWGGGWGTMAVAEDGVYSRFTLPSSYSFFNIPESFENPTGKHLQPPVGDYLVARFAIDLRDADGGPDGDWDEPGDDGEPYTTLHVTATSSLSGRHVDPLDIWDNTHYQYWPADQEQAWNYGCGGDGGHGGGGGGGSAMVIVKDFATSKASDHQVKVLAGRHGYGSGGGKGGQGGDGCIIVYW